MFKPQDLTPLELTESRRYLMRHFIVTGNKQDKVYKVFRYSVVCSNINKAVAMAEKKFPGCIILSIADQGVIDEYDNG